jgi:7,8-dihydroneopterin aldolase/epimerase/oxygenase
MDRIVMEGMSFLGRHGVHPAEREMGVHFSVDVILELDVSDAARSDDLEDTIDYGDAYAVVREVMEGEPCHLVETLSGRIADRLLALEQVQRATVTVRKRPPVSAPFQSFGVEVSRPR